MIYKGMHIEKGDDGILYRIIFRSYRIPISSSLEDMYRQSVSTNNMELYRKNQESLDPNDQRDEFKNCKYE